MTFLGRVLAVAIPDTTLEGHDSLREKTAKLGIIARACAVYGVDLVEIYVVPGGHGESTRIKKVLEYLETPQYLRKRLFGLDSDLKYAGLLPPLRTPSHKQRISLDVLKPGELREGITNADGTVDVGLDRPPVLGKGTAADRRVTVRIVSRSPLRAEVVGREEVEEYWGYGVEVRTIEEVLDDARFPLKIATSRLGDPLRTAMPRLKTALQEKSPLMFVFGSPSRGLFDLAGPRLRRRTSFVINLFSEQHVRTVRTEEALFAALNLLNFQSF